MHLNNLGKRCFAINLANGILHCYHIGNTNTASEICNVTVLDNIRHELNNVLFWLKFKIVKSLGDGHCFMHSIVKSLSEQIPHLYTTSL